MIASASPTIPTNEFRWACPVPANSQSHLNAS
jgi:hypothetical protein